MEYVALVVAIVVVALAVIVGLVVRPGSRGTGSRRAAGRAAEQRGPADGRPPGRSQAATKTRPAPPTPSTTGPTDEPAARPVVPEPAGATAGSTAVDLETIAPTAGRLVRLRSRLSRSQNSMGRGLLTLLSRDRLDEDTWDEIEETLLAADMGVRPTQELVESLRTKVRVLGASTPKDVRALLRDELLAQVGTSTDRSLRTAHEEGRPAILLVVGVNGTGKTTTCGKLARVLVADGNTVVLGAADTFRAAAADQLETWGARVGRRRPSAAPRAATPLRWPSRRSSAVINDAADTVLIDTAGRLHTKTGLMDELGKVKRVVEKHGPVDEVLLVLDATTGQNAVVQARVFTEVVDVTGVVLTKLDGTAKGGIVVAVQRELGVPVKLVGLGEGADDLAPFEPGGVRRRAPGRRGRVAPAATPSAPASAPYPEKRSRRPPRPVEFSACSRPSPTGSTRSSRRCAARVGSPRPTSTRPRARSGSRCSRPTSRCRRSARSSPRSRSGPRGAEVSQALNPAQQVIKIVNEELVEILGGETRDAHARQDPADRDHARRPAGHR